MNKLHLLLLTLFIGFVSIIGAQEKKKIKIEYAGKLTIDDANYPGAKILTRDDAQQVHIEHGGANMWCDKAIHYSKDNFIEAYGNVKLKQGDTINMTSKYIEYSGITELAFASGDVVMTDPNSTITSDTLYMDRTRQQAFYRSGGTVVKDSSGTITSKIGRYYMDQKKYQFVNDVVLVSEESTIHSDYFDFYSDTGYAYLFGPSTITTEESKTYCEKGFYDTEKKVGYALKKARIDYDDRIIEGDSLFFDNNKSFASASNNIKVTDTINKSIVKGHYAEVFKEKDSLFITKRALAITVQENDSIYIHADKIMVTGKPENRIIKAYYNARIFKTDLSGKADSIHSNEKTGITKLLNIPRLSKGDKFSVIRKPILWNLENQMTGDTIHLISNPESEKIDSLLVFENAFVISRDTISENGYNQINGKRLVGLFNDENELNKVDVTKNAQSIFYARNDKQELIGIDKSKSGSISILFSGGDIDEYTRYNQIDGNLFPESKFPEKEKFLKGFDWREDERPRSVEDLFKDDPPLKLPVIKGLEDYVPQEDFVNDVNERIKKARQKSNTTNSITSKASRNLPKPIKYTNNTVSFTDLTLKGGPPFSLTEKSKTSFNFVKDVGTPTTAVMAVYVEFTYDDLSELDRTFVLELHKAPKSESLNQLKIVKGITDWNPINYPITLTYQKNEKYLINIYELIMASSKKNIDYYSGVNSLQLLIGYFKGFEKSVSTNTILDYDMTMYFKKDDAQNIKVSQKKESSKSNN